MQMTKSLENIMCRELSICQIWPKTFHLHIYNIYFIILNAYISYVLLHAATGIGKNIVSRFSLHQYINKGQQKIKMRMLHFITQITFFAGGLNKKNLQCTMHLTKLDKVVNSFPESTWRDALFGIWYGWGQRLQKLVRANSVAIMLFFFRKSMQNREANSVLYSYGAWPSNL